MPKNYTDNMVKLFLSLFDPESYRETGEVHQGKLLKPLCLYC